MVVSFEDINDKFDRVFGFIRRDLERILELEAGGNFAITLLITCACETLAKFRYGSSEGSKVFRDLFRAGPYKAAAKPLYNVLRNGLVHRYEAPEIRFARQTLVTAGVYAEIRLELKRTGKPIPLNDIWVAALARQHALPVLSNDTHFDLVEGITRIAF